MREADGHHAMVQALIARQPTADGGRDGVMPEMLRLCRAAVEALAASGAGVSIVTQDGGRGVATASDPDCERLEELQFVLGEGPCIDALSYRHPVLVPDLADGAIVRWPVYTPAVQAAGARAVFAFPLQIGGAQLGVLDVFRDRPGTLSAEELAIALTFADVALHTVLDGQAGAAPDRPPEGLDGALATNAVLWQAQGMVMAALDITLAEAMSRIRAHAYTTDRSVHDLAIDIVARRFRLDSDSR